jgi:transposase
MNPSPTPSRVKYVGLDVHAETVAVAIADSAGELRGHGTVPAHSHSLDRLHRKLSEDGSEVRYAYEAGPTGFWLARHFAAKGILCHVVPPSLVPRKPGDRVKTDRRDALALARLFRAGELPFVHLPDEADEAIRDLVRTRLRAVEDLRRCGSRIKGFLLRYGRRYDGSSSWTAEHLNYLSRQKFDHPGQQIAFEELVGAVQEPAGRIERLTKAIEAQVKSWKRRPLVEAFMCLRGMALINSVTWVAEIGDFGRFGHPSQLMSYIGITPSEDSSGLKRRQGSITRTGNEACRRAAIEAAWQYRLPARVTPHIRKRHHGRPKEVLALAWKAQTRLCERYQTLVRNRKKAVVTVTAVARELVGFLWAVARQVEGRAPAAGAAKVPPEKTALKEGTSPGTPPEAIRAVRQYRLDGAKKYEHGKRPAERNRSVKETVKKASGK